MQGASIWLYIITRPVGWWTFIRLVIAPRFKVCFLITRLLMTATWRLFDAAAVCTCLGRIAGCVVLWPHTSRAGTNAHCPE